MKSDRSKRAFYWVHATALINTGAKVVEVTTAKERSKSHQYRCYALVFATPKTAKSNGKNSLRLWARNTTFPLLLIVRRGCTSLENLFKFTKWNFFIWSVFQEEKGLRGHKVQDSF